MRWWPQFQCVCWLQLKKVLKFGEDPEEIRNLRSASFQQGHQAKGGLGYGMDIMETRWDDVKMRGPGWSQYEVSFSVHGSGASVTEEPLRTLCPAFPSPSGPGCIYWKRKILRFLAPFASSAFRWWYKRQVGHKPPDPEELGGTCTANKEVDTKQVPVLRDNHQRVSGPDQTWLGRATVTVKVKLI